MTQQATKRLARDHVGFVHRLLSSFEWDGLKPMPKLPEERRDATPFFIPVIPFIFE